MSHRRQSNLLCPPEELNVRHDLLHLFSPILRHFSYHMARQRYVPYPKPEGKNRLLISIRLPHRLCPLLNGTIKQEDGFNNAAFMGAPPTMS
jgi:hypothetical protein